jgi:hypothetical protein
MIQPLRDQLRALIGQASAVDGLLAEAGTSPTWRRPRPWSS